MTNDLEVQEAALLLTKAIFTPLIEWNKDNLLTPSEKYFKIKAYISQMEQILSKGDINDIRN